VGIRLPFRRSPDWPKLKNPAELQQTRIHRIGFAFPLLIAKREIQRCVAQFAQIARLVFAFCEIPAVKSYGLLRDV
jgi:hypothetical protein